MTVGVDFRMRAQFFEGFVIAIALPAAGYPECIVSAFDDTACGRGSRGAGATAGIIWRRAVVAHGESSPRSRQIVFAFSIYDTYNNSIFYLGLDATICLMICILPTYI